MCLFDVAFCAVNPKWWCSYLPTYVSKDKIWFWLESGVGISAYLPTFQPRPKSLMEEATAVIKTRKVFDRKTFFEQQRRNASTFPCLKWTINHPLQYLSKLVWYKCTYSKLERSQYKNYLRS